MYRNYKSVKTKNDNNEKKFNENHRSSSLHVNLSFNNDSMDADNIKITSNSVHKLNTSGCDRINDEDVNNSINDVLNMIHQKDEALNESCSRLRDAIVSKTKEIFNNYNDLCTKTIKVLQSQPHQDIHKKQRKNSSIRWNKSQTVVSPRRTRASTARIYKNNSVIAKNGFFTESSDESINFGNPVMCSTFNNHHCNIHESCNREIRNINNIHVQNISVTQAVVPGNLKEASPASSPPKKLPTVIDIQPCHITIERIDPHMLKRTIIQQEPMELTEAQGNIFHESVVNNPSQKKDLNNLSMCVNTSLDLMNHIQSQNNKQIDRVQDQNVLKNITNVHNKKSNMIAVPRTTIYCNTINIINSPSVIEVNKTDNMSVMEIPKNVSEGNVAVSKNTNDSARKISSECSFVEGTPEARSVSSRTQTMLNRTKKDAKTIAEVENRLEDLDLEKTINLDQLVIPPHVIRKSKGTIIIQESSDDSDDENSEPISNKPPAEKVFRKKRLFTQHDSPSSIKCSPATQNMSPLIPLKRKELKRKQIKKQLIPECVRRSYRLSKSLSQPNINNMSSSSSIEDGALTQNLKSQKKKKKRLIKSKKIVIKKPVRANILNTLHNISNNKSEEETGLRLARGSDVFMMNNKIFKRRKTHNAQSIVIVSTGLTSRDKDLVKNAANKIEGAKMESVVTRKTTHVVTTGVRTINLLRGIIRGCWIVKLEWVKKSMEAGRWLNPEKYEIDCFRAIKENRRDKEIFGSAYVSELFTTCSPIYIDENTTPPRDVLKELIGTAGGSLTEDRRKAKVIVGPEDIKEVWVLDSITSGELQSINQYKR
ncbi:uncharacterized protein MCPH1 [Chelonus insularis]|uniref:uncharacterized protein MCPH1 n=1 Tax=Chelonus insularis TaxID=460826 RepID=UPI00158B24D5|nr:uncharacterized protein LOC118070962 [Chelonus insularis]XP_034945757.1 uncharacterized protein LOC118070962 [Chelonus insularis]